MKTMQCTPGSQLHIKGFVINVLGVYPEGHRFTRATSYVHSGVYRAGGFLQAGMDVPPGVLLAIDKPPEVKQRYRISVKGSEYVPENAHPKDCYFLKGDGLVELHSRVAEPLFDAVIATVKVIKNGNIFSLVTEN